jgi:hypothetical protein
MGINISQGYDIEPSTNNPQGAFVYVSQDPNTGVNTANVDVSSLNKNHALKTSELNRIYEMLVKMIGILQEVAVAEADQLKFLNKWQQAYTDKMSQVPTFVQNQPGMPRDISGQESEASALRQDLNQSGSEWTQKMQSRLNIVQDTAKAQQTTLSQTQNAIDQQSSLATSIIQQMNTILASIFR